MLVVVVLLFLLAFVHMFDGLVVIGTVLVVSCCLISFIDLARLFLSWCRNALKKSLAKTSPDEHWACELGTG